MQSGVQLFKEKGDDALSRLPDFGPLNIGDMDEFLLSSKVFFYENFYKPLNHKETLSDFEQLRLLGHGNYGDVILIKHKGNGKHFAMKAIEKKRIAKTKQIEHVKTEKLVLQSINFPLTVYLMFFFKDNSYIYMVMPFIPGGELFIYLRKEKKFDEIQARFYVSQIILALEYLHFLDLIYRDLKPENILIDQSGYLKLTDFGFCKHMVKQRTYTICGTPEYMAPELILSKGYSKSVDWWTVGVLMFELVAGYPPFSANDSMKLYKNIIGLKYKIPSHFSTDLRDLVQNILQVDLSKRYGNMKKGVDDIKGHKWFRTTNWMAVLNRRLTVKYQPISDKPGEIGHLENFSGWSRPRVAKEDTYALEFADF